MIGKFLGSHKERHLKILKAYCHWLDFSGLEFDRALRMLLSQFKLPGEAQQIERIVEIFAKVYHMDNPNVFIDQDTPFILAYSLLMLNTDAHSEKIPKNKKMTKQQFIQNNIRVCKNISEEYLGKMYDNIARVKFETKTDCSFIHMSAYLLLTYHNRHRADLQSASIGEQKKHNPRRNSNFRVFVLYFTLLLYN